MNASEALIQEKYFHDLDREALSAARAELADTKEQLRQVALSNADHVRRFKIAETALGDILGGIKNWKPSICTLDGAIRIATGAWEEIQQMSERISDELELMLDIRDARESLAQEKYFHDLDREALSAARAKLKGAEEAFAQIGIWLCLMTPNGPCQGASPCPVCIASGALEDLRK